LHGINATTPHNFINFISSLIIWYQGIPSNPPLDEPGDTFRAPPIAANEIPNLLHMVQAGLEVHSRTNSQGDMARANEVEIACSKIREHRIAQAFWAVHDGVPIGMPPWAQAMQDNIMNRFNAVDVRFNAIDVRFNAVDARFDAVDARFEAVDARFDAVDARLDGLLVRDANSSTKNWNRRAIMSTADNTLRAIRKTRPGWGPGLPGLPINANLPVPALGNAPPQFPNTLVNLEELTDMELSGLSAFYNDSFDVLEDDNLPRRIRKFKDFISI
jgi:hypothetical protein